jgi:uncharacterized protein YndB with AHSA1/START domain
LRFEAFCPQSPEEVWRALTDSRALAEWLMENDFLPYPGHRFHFRVRSRFGGERRVPCEVLTVEEPRLLSFRWGGKSVVTFRLQAEAAGTRLTLEHSGLRGLRGSAMAWVLGRGWVRKIHERLPGVLTEMDSIRPMSSREILTKERER